MNLYFLVEGRRTEMRLYPEWLKHLLPHYTRVDAPNVVREHEYYLVSGEGYPRLLDVMLAQSIEDINACGRFSYLIVCLDADEATIQERQAEVEDRINNSQILLDSSVTAKVVIQNRTIETWCLGNRSVFSRNPTRQTLREFLTFYDVSTNDPESMGFMADYDRHAEFHHDYLRELLAERNVSYSKRRPGHVADEQYLNQLQTRIQANPGHLSSLKALFDLCAKIRQLTS